ncbi:MAG: fibronectin type III domain-containing protein [Treponema sp.]|jgi:hypothetical protein|nr:fibronectin type III domain-containing protein [Treponema sp.]
MKNMFTTAALGTALVFAGSLLAACKMETDAAAGGTVLLEVRNESSITLTDITWNNETFGDGEKTVCSPGSIFTKAVDKTKAETGAGYIFFAKSGLPCRTRELVSFTDGYIFTFVDNMLVVDTSDTAHINTLALMAKRMTIPAGVHLVASRGRLAASWTAVDGAASYNVYYGTSAAPPETPAQTNLTGTTTVITGLINETMYYVWVQAVNSGGVSALSERAAAAPTGAYTAAAADTFAYAIAGINNDPGAGSYTITVTSSFSAAAVTFTAVGDKTITITGDGANRSISNAAFTVPGGITLELENLTLTASPIRVETDGTLTLKPGAVITGADAHGVFVDGGTVNMTGGTISGNSTYPVEGSAAESGPYGAGVYINSGTFVMSGGEISNNEASYSNFFDYSNMYIVKQSYGGGVYINGGTFIMSNGSISGNSTDAAGGLSSTHAYAYGGGVYVQGGTFTMTGGTISGNSTATSSVYNTYGGGVYVAGGSFSKTGGTIDGSNSADIGKAAYVAAGGKKRNAAAGPEVDLNSAAPDNWE